MRQILTVLMLGAAVVSFGVVAKAQYGAADGPYQPDSINALVDKVSTDLNHGYDQWHISKGDRARLNNAEKQLRAFARDWRDTKFDKGALEDSANAIQHVLNSNHLSGPERDALWGDVEQLRHMREAYDRHDIGRW